VAGGKDDDARQRLCSAWRRTRRSGQYLGGVVGAVAGVAPGAAAPPDALHDDFPLPAGAAAPPPALHELFPPAAGGVVAPGSVALPPPHATVEPISIPATADIARAFAMFIVFVSSLLLRRASSVYPGDAAPVSVKRTRARLVGYRPNKAIFFL